MSYTIAVLPSLHAKGWGGVGGYEDCGLVERYTLDRFAAPQTTDAMAVAYSVPNAPVFPRLNLGAESVLKAAGSEPTLDWAIFDIDNPAHEPWEDLREAEACLELAIVNAPEKARETAAGYTTRAGYRLMFKLDPPLPVSVANSFLRQLGESLPVEVDPASYEWTRLFRLPRARRDGEVLTSYIDFEALEEGCALDPHSLGFHLTSEERAVRATTDTPSAPEELTWEDLAHAADMEWVLRGEAVPPDGNGSSYATCRTTLARIAHRGKYEDPHKLAAFLWNSVLATTSSSLDTDELWKLAEWVAERQEAANAEEERQGTDEKLPEPGPLTSEEWSQVRRALRGKNSKYSDRLRDGTVLTTSRDSREPTTYGVLRQVVMRTSLPADAIYRAAYPSVLKQKAPLLDEMWPRLQEMVREERGGLDEETALRQAFCTQFPLVVKAVDSKRLFHLDTTTQPYSYRTSDTDLLQHDLSRYGKAVPFDVSYGGLRTADILDRYGGRADRTVMVSGRRGVTYSPSKSSIMMGVHSLDRNIPATKHPEVLEWLRLIGGSDPEGFLDWLACVTYTADTPLCALYIEGGSGIGKSLLAKGIASMWGAAPVDYNVVMNSSFNGEVAECPLLFADEGIRINRRDDEGASQKFRNVVASTSHYINAKNQKPVVLYGALRVFICANDEQGIPFRESLGAHGIQAIIDRVLHVKTGEEARLYLERLPPGEIGERWAPADGTPGKVSETLMWLREHRKVEMRPGARYLVTGKETDWHRSFTANQGIKPDVLRAVAALVEAQRGHGNVPDSAYFHDDPDKETVWVSLEAPVVAWKYARSNLNPNPKTVHGTVRDLAKGEPVRMYFRNRTVRRTVYPIPYRAFYDADIWEEDEP